MSREIIRDIVLPIVAKIMTQDGYVSPYRPLDIRDEQLEEFLEEEMRRYFGLVGGNGCQHLKTQLEEAKKNDPYAFEYLLRQLLKKYVKLRIKMKRTKKLQEGPPDRFLQQLKKYDLLGYSR